MRKTTLCILVAGVFAPAGGALAQMQVHGSVGVDLLSTKIHGEKNPFRFDEYRDLDSGAALGADIRGEYSTGVLRFFGENIGRDDQFLEFSGGRYGLNKYTLYNDKVLHNLTHNAITPFSGVGSNTLTFAGAAPSTDTATWNTFDYRIKHDNYGGTFETKLSANSPFYFRATANQKETQGLRPNGNAGSSPGGPVFELPMLVDFRTTDASAEAGYLTKAAHYSVNLSWSRFRSQDDFMTWRNPALTSGINTEQTTIAPDNNQWKIGANAVWKQLPMGSTLGLRATYSKLTNDVPVIATAIANVGGAGQVVNTNPSSATFNGEVIHKTASASLNSQWMRGLDSRVYWNYARKDNHSTALVFTPINTVSGLPAQACDINVTTGVASTTTCSTELFHYAKNNLGVDLQYRLSPQNRVAGGLDYTDTKRERIDFDRTKDSKVYVELKNTSLEDVSARIRYQHLHRRGDFKLGDLVLPTVPPALQVTLNNVAFAKFLRRFDVADNDQDTVRLSVDWTPRQHLDLGAELFLKNNQYKDFTLGREKDRRQEYYLTAAYGDPKKFRVSTFFDYEHIQYDSTHWVGNVTSTFPAPVSATQYLWSGKVKDENWVIGLGADWVYSGQLMFKASYTWQKTDGTVDLASNNPAVSLFNVQSYDSFRRTTLNLRAIWSVTKTWELTLGFAHERFKYSDIQMDDYRYTFGAGAGTSFLSGAYAFPDFRANVLYTTLKYNF